MGNSNTRFFWPAAIVGLAASLGLLVVASCENLPPVDENVCGNRVVEQGEDCDGNPADAGPEPDEFCNACRYVCNVVDKPSVVCPEGYGCGIDGTCRHAGGLSVPALSIGGGGVQHMLSGDFDGDSRQDAVAIGETSLDILFFGTNGLIDESITLPNNGTLPGVGDIDGDGHSDIVLILDDALGVLSGQDNRTLVPENYFSGDLQQGTMRLVPLGQIDDETTMLAFLAKDGQTRVQTVVVQKNLTPTSKQIPGGNFTGALVGAVAVSTNTSGPEAKCPVIAFGLAGATSKVYVLSCGDSGTFTDAPKITEITLAPGVSPWAGAFFADADADGDDDLVFGIQKDKGAFLQLHVHRNDGNGMFVDPMDPPGGPLSPLDVVKENCVKDTRFLAGPPLAVGDIDGDGSLDVVDARGVLYNPYAAIGLARQCKETSDASWTHAVIGDFNGNSFPDVMAARQAEALLDVWSRVQGGELNTFTLSVEEPISELVRGDFDGDSVDDAVVRLSPPPMSTMPGAPANLPPGELVVLFGRPLAIPESPLSLGIFPDFQHIAVGRMTGKNAVGGSDLLDDIVVLSSEMDDMPDMPDMPDMQVPVEHFTVVEGNVGRRLLAPLSIQGLSVGAKAGSTPVAAMGAPTQIAVSRFAADRCPVNLPQGEIAGGPRSTLVAQTGSEVWIAGCEETGSSLRILDGLNTGDGSLLIAPVNHDDEQDALALFMRASNGGRGLWVADYDANTRAFDPLPMYIPGVKGDLDLVLPNPKPLGVPALSVDVDGNGRRDVVLLANTASRKRGAVAIFWNDGTSPATLTETNVTVVELSNPYFDNPDPNRPNDNDPEAPQGIADIALLNTDQDTAKELAILTGEGLYLLNLVVDNGVRTFPLATNVVPFESVRNGHALLAIDANSDGVDDLLVAEVKRLRLFLGKEFAR